MSLITRCPACGTMFKVVPDQLRISEGWVRCGHCADVFDATAHLQGDAVQVDAGAAAKAPVASRANADRPSSDAPESEAFESSLNTEIGEGVAFEAPDSVQIEQEAQDLVEHPLDRPFELRRRDDGKYGRRARRRRSPSSNTSSSRSRSQGCTTFPLCAMPGDGLSGPGPGFGLRC